MKHGINVKRSNNGLQASLPALASFSIITRCYGLGGLSGAVLPARARASRLKPDVIHRRK